MDYIQFELSQPNNIEFLLGPAKDYQYSVLMDQKTNLNNVKSLLDHYYNLKGLDKKSWLSFQYFIDAYKPLRSMIEKKYNAKHVTNAWLKYYELISNNFIPHHGSYKVFFNAELPGSSLSAFNHFVKTLRPQLDVEWKASSLLSSKNDSALDDTYGLYALNKSHWLMSSNNDGDVTKVSNILDFEYRLGLTSNFGGIDFYSHDAGIGVDESFNEQELLNSKIHLGCAISGFLTLKKGGTFIGKQYTFFESFTWNLLLIYSQLFESFYITKPVTSRPYNSEIYIIGTGYKGISLDLKTLLLKKLKDFNTIPFFPCELAETLEFNIVELEQISSYLSERQMKCIKDNINLYETYKHDLSKLKLISTNSVKINKWLKDYPVYYINNKKQLKSF